MKQKALISWLLESDVSIQYQVHKDLLSVNREDLREKIEQEGWGAKILSLKGEHGHWGQKFYQPKWISSHYTLLDLRNLWVSPSNNICHETLLKIFKEEKGPDGGIRPIGSIQASDVCINGMVLNYASYFGTDEQELRSVVDFLLSQKMPDGGFNCRSNRSGAVHSSLHSTISVLEGITEYLNNGYTYQEEALKMVRDSSVEFILMHHLYLSDRTGKIIHPGFLKLPYPSRWKYDILRALDYFQYAKIPWDDRMKPAIDLLLKKRKKDGTWNVQAKHPGKVHFDMEKAGNSSRWNTLRALRVLNHYNLSVV